MRPTIIEWDGSNIPEDFRRLPPGRYVVEHVEELDELTPEEDAGLRIALDDLDAGHEIPYEEAMRELRSGLPSE